MTMTEAIRPLPEIDAEIAFVNCRYITDGTHAFIYKVDVTYDTTVIETCCLKIFRKGMMTPYNLEITAYEYLRHAGVEYYIPQVYGCGHRTVSSWGLEEIEGDRVGTYYGILMEWLEGAEQVSEENITLEQTLSLVVGLLKIHDAGVLHADICQENIVVIPRTSRGVWLDFSCAKVGHEYYHKQELEYEGLLPIILVRVQYC